jgi:hypothetical protein
VVRKFLTYVRSGSPFRTIVAVLGAVAVTLGIIGSVRALLPKPEPAIYSVLMVVDTSDSMKEQFGKRTKFEAVRDQILRFARRSPEAAIAIRFTGNICSEEYDPPAVGFKEENVSAIEDALGGQTPGNESVTDFASAVVEGVNDFRRSDTAKDSPSQSIWTFLGSAKDGCTTNAIDEVELALEGFATKGVKFNFFGVGASQAEKRQLDNVLAALKGAGYEAYVKTPKNVSQLREDVRDTVLREVPSQ